MNILSIEKLAESAGLKVGTNISGVQLVGTPCGNTISHLTIEDLQRYTNEVLEEAAKVCYDMQNGWPSDDHIQCGDAIRALKQNL